MIKPSLDFHTYIEMLFHFWVSSYNKISWRSYLYTSSSNLCIQFSLESTPKKLSLSPPLLRFQYASGPKPNDQFSINSFSFLPPVNIEVLQNSNLSFLGDLVLWQFKYQQYAYSTYTAWIFSPELHVHIFSCPLDISSWMAIGNSDLMWSDIKSQFSPRILCLIAI